MQTKDKIFELLRVLKNIDTTKLSQGECVAIFNALSDVAKNIVRIDHPVLNVKLIHSIHVKNNDYNPNNVAPPEYRLLKHSIEQDGLTMPIVVAETSKEKSHVIIDGYHRNQLINEHQAINISLAGYTPVVILKKALEERISSSIRHNMARGSHQVELTAKLVIKLKETGWDNEDIGRELGMSKDEVLRMQQITGLADAFKNHSFSTAWE